MLPLSEVAYLKRTLMEQFNLYMHMHDSWGGGQSFTFDEPLSQDVKTWMEEYFQKEDRAADFDDDDMGLVVGTKGSGQGDERAGGREADAGSSCTLSFNR
jgi:hypothetical protein